MLGNPDWFKRRKYGGWGLTPKNHKGWLYIACFFVPLVVFQSLPFWNDLTRIVVTVVWILILVFDTIDIMRKIKKDEREKIHEAISDRNTLWFMIFVLIIGVLYYSIVNGMNSKIFFEPFITVALVGGVIVKGVSEFVLDKND